MKTRADEELFNVGVSITIPAVRPVLTTDWLDVLPATANCLRDYQRKQIADIAAVMRSGQRRIIAQAPTGAGKTHIMAVTIAAALSGGLRVLVLATRTRLVRQVHERLAACGFRRTAWCHRGAAVTPSRLQCLGPNRER